MRSEMSPDLGTLREQRIVAFWLVLIVLVFSLSGVLVRLDHLVFDLGQRLRSSSVSDDLVIVAIDEASLSQVGRWPWARDVHTRMLHRVCAEQPAVIGLDLAFSEASQKPADDVALAKALAACRRVVLPLVIETTRRGGQVLETPPIPLLLTASAGLGRVGVRLDEDGIARAVDLYEGVGRAAWPLFAAELLRVARQEAASRMGMFPPDDSLALVREEMKRFEFAGAPGSLPQISYVRVLEGDFPAGFFTGKTVLIGVTAVGLGDFLPTPVSAKAQPMSGVEVQANLWLSLRNQRMISLVPEWVSALIGIALALVSLCWLPRLMPLPGLLASLAWFLTVGFLAANLPGLVNVWLAPSGALVAILAAFPLWSWQRLEVARRHLDRELQQLGALSSTKEVQRLSFEQRIERVQSAQQRLQFLEAQRNEALAFISHDLRSPLAGAVQRLENEPSCSPEQLLPPLRRAQTMAMDFLRLARAEALGVQEMKPVEVTGIVHQAIDEIHGQARQRRQQLVRHVPDAPVWIRGDFEALERLVINLLQNAVIHAPDDSSIDIGLDISTRKIGLWVENPGRALDQELLGRLFQRYSRGANATGGLRATTESTGLGLYFVRLVAEKHGGSVGVACHDGKIRFEVNFPASLLVA